MRIISGNHGGCFVNELTIPYAANPSGEYVTPDMAEKGTKYRCPQCDDVVILRKGEVIRSHFAHKSDSDCTGESVEHIVAKEWLRQAALDSRPKQLIDLECRRCGEKTKLLFPSRFVDASMEMEWVGNRRPDVMLHTISKRIAVEVYRSHAVDASKATDLTGAPWFEVSAESILANPFVWQCTQTNIVVECPACVHESHSLEKIKREIGEFYRECRLASCTSCGKETPFLLGDLDDLWPTSPYVHKFVVNRRKSRQSMRKVRGFSVRNSCIHCGQMQAGFYPGRSAYLWFQPYASMETTGFWLERVSHCQLA